MTSIILAGGKSSRLGRNKAFELLREQKLIYRVIYSLASLSSEIIIVTAQGGKDIRIPPKSNAKIVVDLYPSCGPLAGIHSGLTHASSSHSLIVACDMPFLNRSLLRYQMSIAPGFDVVIPSLEGHFEPLHAVYSKKCLRQIEAMLEDGLFSVNDLLPRVNVRYNVRYVEREEIERFDPDHMSFFNLNTDTDLQKARVLLKR